MERARLYGRAVAKAVDCRRLVIFQSRRNINCLVYEEYLTQGNRDRSSSPRKERLRGVLRGLQRYRPPRRSDI
ncbi:hypothetical protein TNCV_4022181 [Trichonephila clavipes]|nr:hypothetical protein TNCV_4022181 [Trichonephila clavipes]